jgi:putative NADPH-quinone reductase
MKTEPRRILLIQGHPDPAGGHFGHALAQAYADAARAAGHEVRELYVATLDFPLLRSKHEWEEGELPPGLRQAQADIAWAQHLVFFFPLWLGGMPALLKGFLEQVARPGFALSRDQGQKVMARKLLTGRSARLVVTMGMPALVYRWIFRAHSLKALERNILGFVGIAPVHETLIGLVEGEDSSRQRWLKRLGELGRRGE